MYYEITVVLNGMQFFATSDRSIKTKGKLKQVYDTFKEKFPEEEGYSIHVTEWNKSGKSVDMEEVK